MNIEIKEVSVLDIFRDGVVLNLFDEYQKESKGSLMPIIKPNLIQYQTFEQTGHLTSVGAYIDDVLIGFITVINNIMPHYKELASTTESFFVHNNHRKYNIGKKLLDKAIEISKSKGSKYFFISAPLGGRLEKAAKGFGFTPTNVVFTKRL